MQANLPKIGQFGHAFRRGIVRPASEAHTPGEAGEKMWRNITLFVGLPSLILSSINCYLQKNDHPPRPEIIDYPYMKILNRKIRGVGHRCPP
nr:PREDICTED: cytochrome c oxidase subunit 6A1, mitochondrial-like isoform X2 [Megachile rotundata]